MTSTEQGKIEVLLHHHILMNVKSVVKKESKNLLISGNIQIGSSRQDSPVKSVFLINIFRQTEINGETKHGDSSIISRSTNQGG